MESKPDSNNLAFKNSENVENILNIQNQNSKGSLNTNAHHLFCLALSFTKFSLNWICTIMCINLYAAFQALLVLIFMHKYYYFPTKFELSVDLSKEHFGYSSDIFFKNLEQIKSFACQKEAVLLSGIDISDENYLAFEKVCKLSESKIGILEVALQPLDYELMLKINIPETTKNKDVEAFPVDFEITDMYGRTQKYNTVALYLYNNSYLNKLISFFWTSGTKNVAVNVHQPIIKNKNQELLSFHFDIKEKNLALKDLEIIFIPKSSWIHHFIINHRVIFSIIIFLALYGTFFIITFCLYSIYKMTCQLKKKNKHSKKDE